MWACRPTVSFFLSLPFLLHSSPSFCDNLDHDHDRGGRPHCLSFDALLSHCPASASRPNSTGVNKARLRLRLRRQQQRLFVRHLRRSTGGESFFLLLHQAVVAGARPSRILPLSSCRVDAVLFLCLLSRRRSALCPTLLLLAALAFLSPIIFLFLLAALSSLRSLLSACFSPLVD